MLQNNDLANSVIIYFHSSVKEKNSESMPESGFIIYLYGVPVCLSF